MKKLVSLLLIAGLLMVTFSASAEVVSKKTGRKWCHKHTYQDEYYKQRPALEGGVGLDLLLFRFGDEAKNLKKVKLELKKDFVDNERGSAYLVAEIDVSSVFAFLKK